jgi:hypothetical protein
VNAGRRKKSERRETKRVAERGWCGQKEQEMVRDADLSVHMLAFTSPDIIAKRLDKHSYIWYHMHI